MKMRLIDDREEVMRPKNCVTLSHDHLDFAIYFGAYGHFEVDIEREKADDSGKSTYTLIELTPREAHFLKAFLNEHLDALLPLEEPLTYGYDDESTNQKHNER